MREVLLHGDGLALAAASSLLHRAGWQVSWQSNPRPKLPFVLLNAASQRLIRDIFGGAALAALPSITRRIVRWGGETRELPHAGLVAPEEVLFRAPAGAPGTASTPAYELRTIPAAMRSVGRLTASSATFRLRANAATDACWVEAVPHGWLFAVMVEPGQAALLGVGEELAVLLSESALIAPLIDALQPSAQRFAAHPRLAETLYGPGWLACGGGALAFDPICGEGVGHALREAILASAILRADAAQPDWPQLAELYAGRLRAGFRRHLEQCLTLYSTGGDGLFWRDHCAALVAALREIPTGTGGEQRYRLVNFDLVPR